MKRDKKKTHRGKPVYTFQGVDYLAKRDTSRCLGSCIKLQNGRYYMTVSDYEKNRKKLWRYEFRTGVNRVIRKLKDRRFKWYKLVESLLHKQRFLTLINGLKQTPFAKLLGNSKLYSKAKEKVLIRRTCSKCSSTDTTIDPRGGLCRCHLCEDWYGCGMSRGYACPDVLVCNQCKHRHDLPEVKTYHHEFSYLKEYD